MKLTPLLRTLRTKRSPGVMPAVARESLPGAGRMDVLAVGGFASARVYDTAPPPAPVTFSQPIPLI